ncbi:MAG: ATP-binding cassette domain-containing protein [Fidelibacterota bacterium]
MTNTLVFSLQFEKFRHRHDVRFGPGLHVIYGSSGCGKTHLLRYIAGIDVSVPTNFSFRLERRPENIQIIFQNPEDQIVAHTLEAELAFSLECQNFDETTLRDEFEIHKSQLTFIDDWNRHPETLSGGEKEILNLVTAFSVHPDCVLIDDGLSFLNRQVKDKQIAFIRRQIRERNTTVLWFTSDINDFVYGDSNWELTLSEFRELKEMEVSPFEYQHRHKPGQLDMVFQNLSFRYSTSTPLINNLNCTIKNARSVGLVGQNGRGKTTVAKLLIEVMNLSSGNFEISIAQAKPRIAYLDQFPEKTLSMESLAQFMNRLILNQRLDRFKRQKCINTLNHHQISWDLIKNDSALDIPWSTLRFALVIILAHSEYDLLLLDEPTFGLGWDQKVVLSRFLSDILKRKHLILISHDREFIQQHCDYILDLDNGLVSRKEDVLIHE